MSKGGARVLAEYWSGHGHSGPSHGAERDAIGWGTPGDFSRCVAQVTAHGKMTEEQAKGYCNLRHHDALGYYPGQHAAMERGKMTVTELPFADRAFERLQLAITKANDQQNGQAQAQAQSDGGGEARVAAGSGLTSGQWTTGSDGPTKNPPKPNPYAKNPKKPNPGKKPPPKGDAHQQHLAHLHNEGAAARAKQVSQLQGQLKELDSKLADLETQKKGLSAKTGVSNFGTASTVKPAKPAASASAKPAASSTSSISSTSGSGKPKTPAKPTAASQLAQVNAQIAQVHQQIAQVKGQLKELAQASKSVRNPRDVGNGRFRTFQGEVEEARQAIEEGRTSDAAELLGSARVLAQTDAQRTVLGSLQTAISRVQHNTVVPELVKLDPKASIARLLVKAAEHGHHIAGTPYTYHHGWIKIDPSMNDCHDGCGGKTKGGKYLPGHDAKHVSHLTEAVKNGDISHGDALASVGHSPKLQGKLGTKLAALGPDHYGSLVIHPMPKDKPDLFKPVTATHPAPGEGVPYGVGGLHNTATAPGNAGEAKLDASDLADKLTDVVQNGSPGDIDHEFSTHSDEDLAAIVDHLNNSPMWTPEKYKLADYLTAHLAGGGDLTYDPDSGEYFDANGNQVSESGVLNEDLDVTDPSDMSMPEEDMQAPSGPPSESDVQDAATANAFGGGADGSTPDAYIPMSDGYKLASGSTPDHRDWAMVVAPNGVGSVFTINPHPDGQAYASQYRNLGIRVTYLSDSKVKIEYKQPDGTYVNDPGLMNGETTIAGLTSRTKVYQLAAKQMQAAKSAEDEKKLLDALTAKPKAPAKPKTPKPAAASAPIPVTENGVGYAVWNTKNTSHVSLKNQMNSNLPDQPGTSGSGAAWKAHVASRLADKITVGHKELMGAAQLGNNDPAEVSMWADAAEHPDQYLFRKSYGGVVEIEKNDKNAVYKEPLTPKVIKEYAASKLVQNWAGTSNDHSVKSLVGQEAARQEFGLDNVFDWKMDEGLSAQVNAGMAEHGAAYRAFLRAQYDLTQEDFAKQGITKVNVSRGMVWPGSSHGVPDWARGLKTGAVIGTPALRPLSSWTVDAQTASNFSGTGNAYRVILKSEVPASAVLSWPQSGFGCLSEYELVVMAGVGNVKVSSAGTGLAGLSPSS